MESSRAIIIGGSHAGAQLCASLRQEGWAGEILLISDEPSLPYHRPPLSKTYLADKVSMTELLIRTPEFYEKQAVNIRCARVTAIDSVAHRVTLSDGSEIEYAKLALCTGARPRQLKIPGANLAGVYYLRTAGDIEAIKSQLGSTRRAVIIGGGYIGLETAASLRSLGIEVTILETAERVLQRVTATQVSDFYARVHREAGVRLHTLAAITAIVGSDLVEGVRCGNGEIFPADIVIIGIGVLPNTELAEAAGLEVSNGIIIDGHGRTSVPDIVAAGDCANYFSIHYERRVRLESVPNAGEHAKVAAATMCDKKREISGLPWFWSDQFDIKLQISGLNQGHNKVIIRGDHITGRSFSCFYFINDRMIAADCINRPQDFVFSKRIISDSLVIDASQLANEQIPLSALLAINKST